MSYRGAGKIVVVACALLLIPEALPAQKAPPLTVMADDAQMTILIRECKTVLDIDEQKVDELFRTILEAMLDAYGEAKTDAAMDTSLQRLFKDVKEKGLRKWCELDAAIWLQIRYPELTKK